VRKESLANWVLARLALDSGKGCTLKKLGSDPVGNNNNLPAIIGSVVVACCGQLLILSL